MRVSVIWEGKSWSTDRQIPFYRQYHVIILGKEM